MGDDAEQPVFLTAVTGEQGLPLLKIQWTSSKPVWVAQWPLPKEKLQPLQELVEEQLKLGHIKPSVSCWNTPVFVIKKKSGKWRLVHDLRAVNAVMRPMGALQPGLPSPSALPQHWHLLIIDLKDCFFSIPLHPDDTEKFAFTVPVENNAGPSQRYEWTVLPQGMANSPTMCQLYVDKALRPWKEKNPQAIVYHYMDDILIASEQPLTPEAEAQLQNDLLTWDLRIAPEKVQRQAP